MSEPTLNTIYNENCFNTMSRMPDEFVDSIVTDPPYGLSFMGKKWDYEVPSVDIWKECLRVLKPGGYLLSFAGTRTQHRMACNIEDAGFEIRDMIAWVYGSGFPKSLNIGKAVDKLQGNVREDLGEQIRLGDKKAYPLNSSDDALFRAGQTKLKNISKGQSKWEGWGTALKPALEPITVARKPLSEKTVAENVLKWGTGGINIDACRVELNGSKKMSGGCTGNKSGRVGYFQTDINPQIKEDNSVGRFPANFIHDGSDEVVGLFPNTKSGALKPYKENHTNASSYHFEREKTFTQEANSGSAARFFYCAKASKAERNRGLDSYLTVKYIANNKTKEFVICKEESMVVVQLLKKVISDTALMSFSIGESGENIMAQCHKDSLSIILMETKKIIESKILNSLMPSFINEYTQTANFEMGSGGNSAKLAEGINKLQQKAGISQKRVTPNMENVKNATLDVLLLISEKENWQRATNFHATVKPIALMQYLIKLVTPENGIVLDPFMGSGTTGIACVIDNFNFIGCELSKEYCDIARERINNELAQFKLFEGLK